MSDLHLDNYAIWDRLFELLYPCDEQQSDEEIASELQEAGIDMRPAFQRMHALLDQHRAREQLARAPELRVSMLEKIRSIVGPKVDDIRSGVREFINRSFSGPEQVAHFHKLEKSATDEDLQTLLDDLSRLLKLRGP